MEEGTGLARLPAASLVVALAALAACDKGEPLGAARAYSDAEIAALEQRVMALVAANEARHCPRPVLHGEARTDPALPDQLSLTEPGGTFAACVNAIGDYRNAHPRTKGLPSPLVDAHDPAAVLLDSKCDVAPATLPEAAVSHVDTCSPYQVGVRALPLVPFPLLHVTHVIGLRASLDADAGHPDVALQLLADGIRAEQDLMRGHPSLIAFMLAVAGESTLLRYADPIIERLQAPDAEVAARLYDALLASEAPSSGVLQGEAEATALHTGLVRTKPPTWQPPGGATEFTWPEKTRSRADRNGGAETMEHQLQAAHMYAQACPERASVAACRQGLIRLSSALAGTGGLTSEMWNEYLGRRAATVSHLAAIRIALEIRRDGQCPTDADLASPRYTVLTSPVALGDTVRVTRTKATLDVSPPVWAERKNATWTIHCP